MNKTIIDSLVARFLGSYDAPAMDAIWQRHSDTFRGFWSDQVLGKGTGIISDAVCDVVIRILDRTGKGNTRKSEVVAKTMVPQGVWRKLFNSLHTDEKLASLVDSSLKEINLERKAALLDELYLANKGRKNRLTGGSASTINALLAAYDPVNNLSAVSLNHRKAQMAFLKLPFDWDQASFGQQIVQSNVLICEGTRALGLDGTARTLTRFLYFGGVMELWNVPLNLDVDIHAYTATEGNKRLVLHLQRERNPAVVRKKKKQASSLDCEICGFSFGRAYGSAASNYCEVHHLVPLSKVEHTTQTRMEDLAILCANCHRVAHLHNPPYTLDEVKRMRGL
jgi:5-methylcytosine-specific restriction endonuclease McrA